MYKPVFQKREVLVFRQFRRKGWALFACLGREVLISVLSVATLSSTKAAGISDEVWRVDSTGLQGRTVWLGDVGVTGSRAPLTKSQAARMVTVLSREDIAQAPVQSINDLLKMAVGIDVRQRGPLGTQTDVGIRGSTQEQIAVLLNGINICDPQTAHNVMDFPVQLSEIVRIEVLEGPAGRLYGTSSLVGAINIVTSSEPTTAKGEVSAEAGSFGYAKFSFIARHSSHSLSGSYQRSDGYSRSQSGSLNTDHSGLKAFYQGSHDGGPIRWSWHLGLSDKGWGSGTFYASPKWQADEQYEHTTKLFSALRAENRQGRLHCSPAVYWNRYHDRYEGYRNRPWLLKYNYNRSDVYGASLPCWFDSPAGRTAFGGELRHEELLSGNLGEPLSRPHPIAGTDRSYTLGLRRTNVSAHVEHNVFLGPVTLSGGFVVTRSSHSGKGMKLYPGIDASWRVTDGLKLFASYNSSLRQPSFTEMYYRLPGYAANPQLLPEEMQAVETGAHYQGDAVEAKLSLFHHHGRNMIDWIMDTRPGGKGVWESVNHTKLNTDGIELYANVSLQRILPAQKLLQSLHLSYGYLSQDKQLEEGVVSQYALEYLRHKLLAQLSLRIADQLHLRLSMRWTDRVGSYTTFAGEVCDYRPYALFDARLTWNRNRHSVYLEGNNLLNNRSYVDYGNVPQPGTWLTCGACMRL